ncbi:MAG: formate dehydrogenase [Myxococcales bacterium]|nr:MAG: formate dehydrogenase [Myxococcales bacterium]
MANGKSFLIDTTKCFACRACQVACKQWHELPAEAVVPANRGTYENPPNLSYSQWVKVQFKETERPDGSMAWNFVRNSCRHCIDAPCRQAAENKDSIVIDAETGAVLFQESTKDESYAKIRLGCPFDIPRQGPDGQLFKCVMCVDRVRDGLMPACAKACPGGGITFGDRDEILQIADERVQALRAEHPDAQILDRRDVRLLILVADPAEMYSLSTRS